MPDFMVFSNLYSTLSIIYIILVLESLGVWLCDLIGLASMELIQFFLLILQVPFGSSW